MGHKSPGRGEKEIEKPVSQDENLSSLGER